MKGTSFPISGHEVANLKQPLYPIGAPVYRDQGDH